MSSQNLKMVVVLGGGLLIGLIGGAFLGSTNSTVAEVASVQSGAPIFTSGLHLVNQEGKVRASFSLWDGEHPALIMGDTHCERRTSLAIYGKERTGLTLYGEDCKRRVALEVQGDDEPTLVLRDHMDVPRVQVVLNPDGSPLLRLFDSNGKTIWGKP